MSTRSIGYALCHLAPIQPFELCKRQVAMAVSWVAVAVKLDNHPYPAALIASAA